jgi:3-hydroxybutyryl-CoA dehydrogenase
MLTHHQKPNIAVAGAGRMGRGISISFAWAGYPVALIDSEERSSGAFEDLAQSVRRDIGAEVQLLADTGVLSPERAREVADGIELVPRLASGDALQAAAFVFEAVLEVLDVKKSTYAWLSDVASPQAIFASTTSTMLADTLAGFVEPSERFCNAHWLNPAYLMPLVEISPSRHTRAETVTALKTLLEAVGKVPVVCKASPGYMISRLQAMVLNEAARLIEEGVASAEDIDKAVRVGFGIRYAIFGPLEFIDWGGGDILYYASNYLSEAIDKNRFSSPKIVERNMQEGRKGLRDGVGFYDYRDRDIAAYQRGRLSEFVGLLDHLSLLPSAAEAAE